MLAPVSDQGKSSIQVLCCIKCCECVNSHWYYPETVYEPGQGQIKNPYAGRCRGCGSHMFTVGDISRVDAARHERDLGWGFIPFMYDLNIQDPFVKGNIFIMGPKEKVG